MIPDVALALRVSRELEQTTDPAARPALAAKRDKLIAELNLAKARQEKNG